MEEGVCGRGWRSETCGDSGNQGRYQIRRAELGPSTTLKHASRARDGAKLSRGPKQGGQRRNKRAKLSNILRYNTEVMITETLQAV